MRRKSISWLLVLATCLACLAGCAPQNDEGDGGGGNVTPPSPPVFEGTELFRDTNFTAFGIPEALGAEWSHSTKGHTGRITKFRQVSKPLKLIPYGNAAEADGVTPTAENENVHWDFIEGEKYGVTDPAGVKLGELLDFRTCVSSEIVENTENSLIFEQYNDYLHETYPDQYPTSDRKLVKRVETDKKGKIRLAYNSYHDIVNESYDFASKFARNTWPHFYLNQSFHEVIDLALYEDIRFGVNVKINKATAVNNWPQGPSDRYDQPDVPDGIPRVSVAQLQGYFLLRDKEDFSCWFVGLSYFSSNASDRTEVFTNEQHGVPFYRIGLEQDQGKYYDMTGSILEVGRETTVTLNLYDQIRYVLTRKLQNGEKYANGGLNPYYQKTIDDYWIVDYHIGWENVGNWDCDAEISGLTAKAAVKKS